MNGGSWRRGEHSNIRETKKPRSVIMFVISMDDVPDCETRDFLANV
jgi:hypothetical protein